MMKISQVKTDFFLKNKIYLHRYNVIYEAE